MPRSCLVCDSDRIAFRFEKAGYKVMRCRSCRFEFVDLDAPADFPYTMYTSDYFVDGHDKFGYADYVADKGNHMKYNQKKVYFIEKHLKGGMLLDVGCAAGFFLEALGPGWSCYGCDPSEAMVEVARARFGDHVAMAAFEDYETDRVFDVITMWDSIEHAVDPRKFLDKAYSLLKDNGLLFIGTMDSISPAPLILGKHWYYYVPPSHLWYFNRFNIAIFLKKSGFVQEKLVYYGKYVSVAEMLLNVAYMVGSKRLAQMAKKISQESRWNLSVPYKVCDDMIVMARKRPR
ncbi:MAG: class I SAM-dependent methyltransferase [Deltaproteobacteria bacterium]|nr:class I SAM-dependent methyltransferase [Deltaproteobacteria bacterium]